MCLLQPSFSDPFFSNFIHSCLLLSSFQHFFSKIKWEVWVVTLNLYSLQGWNLIKFLVYAQDDNCPNPYCICKIYRVENAMGSLIVKLVSHHWTHKLCLIILFSSLIHHAVFGRDDLFYNSLGSYVYGLCGRKEISDVSETHSALLLNLWRRSN
jgi:hypothetical protein